MKRLLSKCRVAIYLIALIPLLSSAANTISYNATYDFSKLTIGTDTLGGITYSTVNYQGLMNGGETGMPSLPIDYIRFSVPYNATNLVLSSSIKSYSSFVNLDYLVYPQQTPRTLEDTTQVIIALPDSSAYYSNNDYPNQHAWIYDDAFFLGENRIITVAVIPLGYLHTTTSNRLGLPNKIRLNLRYDLTDSLSTYPLIRRNYAARSEGYKIVQEYVVNPNDVITNAPGSEVDSTNVMFSGMMQLPQPMLDSINNPIEGIVYSNLCPTYDYMIIVPDSMASSLKRIVALKNQKGYSVGIVKISEIIDSTANHPWYNNINPSKYNDSARVIREYLKYAYCIGNLKYVLLAGKDVPFKYISFFKSQTDQYYVDLTSDWDTPSRFRHPELFVGRIYAKTDEQINNYTDKLIRYELNPGKGDYSYLDRAIYTNAVDQYIDSLSYSDIIKKGTDSIFHTSTVIEENRADGTPSGQSIINEINNTGYGFISFNNHGQPMGLIVYGRGGTDPRLYKWLWALEGVHAPISSTGHANDDPSAGNGLDNLNNKYYPSICFSTGCELMPFKASNVYSEDMVNFGESFTTGKDYGGPAFLGNTVEAGFEGAILQSRVASFLKSKSSKLGEALAYAKVFSLSDIYKDQNLLGDPEFEVWTETPVLYSNIQLNRYDDSITISGIDADTTIIAYFNNDLNHGLKFVSTSDYTLNNVSPNSSVMLYKKNHIPFIAPMELQNVTIKKSQYVIADDFVAGSSVNNNRTNGFVTVKEGVNYEIEASGNVILEDGFIVKKGASFAVYPSCF